MFHRINQKLYGIAFLVIAFSALAYGGVALFLDGQTRAAEEEQVALVAAGDFYTLRQMFSQLRAWDRDILLKGEQDAESRFILTMQRLKERLTQFRDLAQQAQRKALIGDIIVSVLQYESNFSSLAQSLTRNRLLETDIGTIYQSIEATGLARGDSVLLRKVFLLNHFQVGYFKGGRPSGYQALRVVIGSMQQAFEKAGLLDDRIVAYVSNYEHSLRDYYVMSQEISELNSSLEESYLSAVSSFSRLSKLLEEESSSKISQSNERRIMLRNAMYLYLPMVGIVILSFLFLLAKKIVSPINALLNTIDEIRSGDVKNRFRPIGHEKDEMNQLGLSFNGMLDAQDDHRRQLLEYQAELTEKIGELAEANQQLQVEIAERKRAFDEKANLEEQLRQSQKMEAIGTLAGGIAHDFNNILSAIVGYTELTRLKLAEGSKGKFALGEVLKAADRARQLVQQILMFSRKSEEKREPVEIDAVVEEATSLLHQTIPATIQFTVSIDSQAGTIRADATQVHQIIMNLCTNAYHAVRGTRGEIDVRLEPVRVDEQLARKYSNLNPGPYAQLTVKDTGTGMEPSVRSRIFEPFFTTKEQGEGTGMGLAVVYGIIQNYGGAIGVESEVGVGTTFRVFFPLVSSQVDNVSDSTGTLEHGSERILFVDDEPALVSLGQMILETLGYQASATTSACDALEMYRRDPGGYDLVISDQTMAEMSGAQLASEMMLICPDVSFILCTGFSDEMDADRAKALGIKGFLMKPVDQKTLARTIREILDARHSEIQPTNHPPNPHEVS